MKGAQCYVGMDICLLNICATILFLFLKRELRKMKEEIKELPTRAGFGGRLSLNFREKTLMDLMDELNRMIDAFEEKNRQSRQMEENVKLSIAGISP